MSDFHGILSGQDIDLGTDQIAERVNATGWIETCTGKRVYPFNMSADDIHIEDIAHSLAMKARYNGHSKGLMSVGWHSIFVSRRGNGPREKLAGLLHDAEEAYFGDLPGPLCRLPQFEFYRRAKDRVRSIIFEKYGIREFNQPEQYAVIKQYDRIELRDEIAAGRSSSHKIYRSEECDWITVPYSKPRFLEIFHELVQLIQATS